MNIALAATGALPALAAMAYVDHLDRKRPEPRRVLRRAAIIGALMTLPCIVLQGPLLEFAGRHIGGPALTLFTCFVAAGAIEELAKALGFQRVVRDLPEFDERLDGIVYGTRVGLGFALLENVGYLLQTQNMAVFTLVFVLRAFATVPVHAVSGGLIGYFAAQRRFDGRGPGIKGGWLLAALYHGAFDAALSLEPATTARGLLLFLFGVALAPVGVFVLRKLAMRALAADDVELGPASEPTP